MQLIPSTSTVPATDCSLLPFKLTADAVGTVRRMFGTMTNLWKLFYYSPKKTEALKNVQSVLCMPELKVVKPSDT